MRPRVWEVARELGWKVTALEPVAVRLEEVFAALTLGKEIGAARSGGADVEPESVDKPVAVGV